MTVARSRFVAVPAISGSLRIKVVRGAANEAVIELANLIRSDLQDGACEVMEGGRAYVVLDRLDDLLNALQAARAEHHAAEASALRAPRLRAIPPEPAPTRATARRAPAGEW